MCLFTFSVEKMVDVGNDILQKQNADIGDVRYVQSVLPCGLDYGLLKVDMLK